MIQRKLSTAVLITVLSLCMILSGCNNPETDTDSTAESTDAIVQSTETITENETAGVENQDSIGSVAPCGMIFGSPLYIGYASDFGDALDGKATIAESYSDETGEEKIWIYSPGGIPEAAIIPVSYEDEEWIAHGQRLAMPLKSDEILELITTVPEGSYPNEAIVCYSEDMESQYAYAIGWNGKTGGVDAYLIEITGVGEAWY